MPEAKPSENSFNVIQTADREEQFRKAARWFFVICFLTLISFRAIIALKLDLFPDEAYYWLWSQSLNIGYLDHPPLIAWTIALFSSVPGEIGIRIPALLCSAITAIIIYKTGLALCTPRAGAFAGAMVLSILPLNIAGFLTTPDSLLIMFWAAGLFLFHKALDSNGKINRYWVSTGIIAGLGLTSKYTMILFIISAFITLISFKKFRVLLSKPGPWSAALIAFLVFSPVLYWNAKNDFASFIFQLNHGLSTGGNSGINTLGEYLATQFFMASPVAAYFMLRFSFMRAFSRNNLPQLSIERSDWLLPFLIVPITFFGITSLSSRVEANWPAPAWLAGSLFIACYFFPIVNTDFNSLRKTRPNRTGAAACLAAALMITVPLMLHTLTFFIPFPESADPAKKLTGWNELLSATRNIYQKEISESTDDSKPFIITRHHQISSIFSYYGSDMGPSVVLSRRGKKALQAAVPFNSQASLQGRKGIIVVDSGHDHPEEYENLFSTIERIGTVDIIRNGRSVAKYHLRLGRNYSLESVE